MAGMTLKDYQSERIKDTGFSVYDASLKVNEQGPKVIDMLGVDNRSKTRKFFSYIFSSKAIADLKKKMVDAEYAAKYRAIIFGKAVSKSSLPIRVKEIGATLKNGGRHVNGWIQTGASKLKNKYNEYSENVKSWYTWSTLKRHVDGIKPHFKNAKEHIASGYKKVAPVVKELAGITKNAVIFGLNKGGRWLSTPIRMLSNKISQSAGYIKMKEKITSGLRAVGVVKDKFMDKVNEFRYTPDYEQLNYVWKKDDELLKATDPKQYENMLKFRADLYNEKNPIKNSNILKQMKKNVAIRKDLKRLKDQLNNDNGNGLGSVELKDLNSDGTEKDKEVVTGGFTQKIGEFNLGKANGKPESVELNDLIKEEDNANSKQKAVDNAINEAKKENRNMLGELKNKNEELLNTASRLLIASAKEYCSDTVLSDNKKAFLASILDFERGLANNADGKNGANWFGKKAKSYDDDASLNLSLTHFFNCLQQFEKISDGDFNIKSAKEASSIGISLKNTFIDLHNLINPGNKIEGVRTFKYIDGIALIRDALDKVEDNKKAIDSLSAFQNSDNGLKKMQEESGDWNFNRMMSNATNARMDVLKSELIKNGLDASAKTMAAIATGLTMGGNAGAAYIAKKLSGATTHVVTPIVEYVKKNFFDDKAIFYNDIFGGKKNFDKICKDYDISAETLERETIKAVGAPSIAVLAERARIEQALQITSNNRSSLKVNTKSLIKAGAYKNADKFNKVYEAQGGSASAKHML